MTPAEVDAAVRAEVERCGALYGDFASMHEAYGVLAEEVLEFLLAVMLKQDHPGRPQRLEHEAVQIAAVAVRIAHQARRVTR